MQLSFRPNTEHTLSPCFPPLPLPSSSPFFPSSGLTWILSLWFLEWPGPLDPAIILQEWFLSFVILSRLKTVVLLFWDVLSSFLVCSIVYLRHKMATKERIINRSYLLYHPSLIVDVCPELCLKKDSAIAFGLSGKAHTDWLVTSSLHVWVGRSEQSISRLKALFPEV